jgi:hypothetical protein
MPTFYTEDIDIDPDEFLDSCSKRERDELIDILVEGGYVIRVGDSGMPISKDGSPLEDEHMGKCRTLSQKFYSMSSEDLEVLETLYRKYS